MEFAERLMDIDNEIWDKYGFTSRPSGDDLRTYLEDIVNVFEEEGFEADDFDDDVIGYLENENFHLLIDAIGVYCEDVTIDEIVADDESGW